jgi:hypothetical protein
MFAIEAEQTETAFVADPTGTWREALCIQEDGRWGRQHGQMGGTKVATAAEPAASALRQGDGLRSWISGWYPGGVWGPHRLADYDARGILLQPHQQAA